MKSVVCNEPAELVWVNDFKGLGSRNFKLRVRSLGAKSWTSVSTFRRRHHLPSDELPEPCLAPQR